MTNESYAFEAQEPIAGEFYQINPYPEAASARSFNRFTLEDSGLFEEWWKVYREGCKRVQGNPGSKQSSFIAWRKMSRRGVNLSEVIEATRWDVANREALQRSKKFAPCLPSAYRYLGAGYWETALEQKEDQEKLSDATKEQVAEAVAAIESEGKQISPKKIEWKGLQFRSFSEVCIAEALELEGVLFFPNARARLGDTSNRCTKECDFLICHEGRWGILEVDGQHWHPVAAKDHDRDRMFEQHGIHFIQRFDAELCRKESAQVVKDFLLLMQRFYART